MNRISHTSFVVALCCMAKLASAQEETTQDSTQDEKVVPQETTFVDQVIEALKNPSGDHMDIYIQLGLAVAILFGSLYYLFGQNKEGGLIVTLDDDALTETSSPQKSKRAKVVQRTQGQQKTRGEAAANQMLEQIISKAESKDKGVYQKLFKDLDDNGPWDCDVLGVMLPEKFIKFRKIIATNQYIRFSVRKEELLQERLKAFKAGNDPQYVKLIQIAGSEYQNLGNMTTKEAGEYVEIGQENYVKSFKACEKNPEWIKQMQMDEENVRFEQEKDLPLNFTKEQIKEFQLEKMQMDFDMTARMSNVMVPSKQQAAQMMMVERTRIMDMIYMKHGVKLSDLMRGMKEYGLEEDEDIKKLAEELKVKGLSLKEDRETARKLSQAQKDEIKEIVAGSGGPITEVPNADGVMSYTTFTNIMSCVMRLIIRYQQQKNPNFRAKRRELLEQKKEQEYSLCIQDYLSKQGILKQEVTTEVLNAFDVTMIHYNKCFEYYKQNPEFKDQFVKDIQSFEHAEQKQQEGTELSKEEALKYVERIEGEKVNAMAQMAIGVKMGKITQQQAALVQMINKQKAFDKLFMDTGVEEEDITRAFFNYRLSESEEFKAIIANQQKIGMEKMQENARKVQEAMMKFRNATGGGGMPPPGMGGPPGMGAPGGPGGAPPPSAAGSQSGVTADNMDF